MVGAHFHFLVMAMVMSPVTLTAGELAGAVMEAAYIGKLIVAKLAANKRQTTPVF
jgi:hypothetical protein